MADDELLVLLLGVLVELCASVSVEDVLPLVAPVALVEELLGDELARVELL